MRCPACHQNIRIQGKFCPKCGEQIFGLPVHGTPPDYTETPPPVAPPPVPEAPFTPPPAPPHPPQPRGPVSADEYRLDYPPAAPAGDILEVTLDDPAFGASAAAGDLSGKVCPYCRFPIKAGEEVVVCPSCAVPHHTDCWRENGGCTTYGCQGRPQMGGAQAATGVPATSAGAYQPPVYGGDLPATARALLEQELDRLATNALVFSLLWFLCFIPALIGLLMGVSVLGQIHQSGLHAGSARAKAWIAIVIACVVLVAVIILTVSAMSGG